MMLTELDFIARAIGYTSLIALGLSTILAIFAITLTIAAERAWKELSNVYELYVLTWWMRAIKKSGRVVPTKKNVARLLEQVDEE